MLFIDQPDDSACCQPKSLSQAELHLKGHANCTKVTTLVKTIYHLVALLMLGFDGNDF